MLRMLPLPSTYTRLRRQWVDLAIHTSHSSALWSFQPWIQLSTQSEPGSGTEHMLFHQPQDDLSALRLGNHISSTDLNLPAHRLISRYPVELGCDQHQTTRATEHMFVHRHTIWLRSLRRQKNTWSLIDCQGVIRACW